MDRKVTLRPITKDDLEWARMLRNKNRKFFFNSQVISRPKQEEWFLTLSYPFFVIDFNGERAGTIAVRKIPTGHEVHNVLIDKKYRRKGLLRQALELLEKAYGVPLFVDIHVNNLVAIRAYTSLGFNKFVCRMQKK